ncbi:15663_t:CDS:2 [Dentiscutata erythropus]|uniref:15663_t:CDS:1 n=1 Tax=Dentiscutata erythropus TaxID=1348616 RepID=A0A9N9F4U5_9GLOM|nr:15663_t:CDS:2 [Dentiscutata erythropus]
MNADELAQYQYQLDQVNLALKNDPENLELLKLKTDLTELISLTTTIIDQETVPPTPKRSPSSISPKTNSTPTTPTSNPILGLSKPLQVGDSCLARWSGDGQFYPATITAIGGGDQVFSVIFKGQKKVNEQVAKQKTWLAFASGTAVAPGKKTTRTKRLVQPPINKRSIFATPENPEGKVGVVGSGKPMTQFQQRGKHIFDRN